jgi:hypothetical protein
MSVDLPEEALEIYYNTLIVLLRYKVEIQEYFNDSYVWDCLVSQLVAQHLFPKEAMR